MDETGPDLKTVQSENDATIARLAGLDPSLGAQAANIGQSHYLLTLAEHQLRWSAGERGIEAARLAHEEWMRDMLAKTESDVRQHMLATIGQDPGPRPWDIAGPSSPVLPNRAARRMVKDHPQG